MSMNIFFVFVRELATANRLRLYTEDRVVTEAAWGNRLAGRKYLGTVQRREQLRRGIGKENWL